MFIKIDNWIINTDNIKWIDIQSAGSLAICMIDGDYIPLTKSNGEKFLAELRRGDYKEA